MTFRKSFLILLFFAAVIMFCGLNSRELYSGDETRVAGIIAGMNLSGDMVTPRLNGKMFLEYPPLYYQLGSICFDLFGFTDAAAKLPSALCAFLSGLAVWLLAKSLKLSPASCLASGVFLLTGAQFFGNGRKCMVDAMLAFFVLFAVLSFYRMLREKQLPEKAAWFLLYGLSLAGGVMTKGLAGLAVPWAGLGVYLVMNDILFEKRISFVSYILLALGVIPAAVPVLYWGSLLYRSGGSEAVHTVLIVNNFGRFSGSQGDHVEPVWYYLMKLPALFQPFLLPLAGAAALAFYQLKKRTLSREMLLILCCLSAPLLMFHCASAKRQVYLLVLYSFCAVLTAWAWVENAPLYLEKLRPYFTEKRLKLCCRAGGVLLILLPAVLLVFARNWNWIFPAAAILLAAAGMRFRKERLLLILMAVSCIYLSIDGVILAGMNRKESLRPMFARCRLLEQQGGVLRVEGIERTEGAAVFYLKKDIPECKDECTVPDGEYHIVRSRKKRSGEPFADGHYILSAGMKH